MPVAPESAGKEQRKLRIEVDYVGVELAEGLVYSREGQGYDQPVFRRQSGFYAGKASYRWKGGIRLLPGIRGGQYQGLVTPFLQFVPEGLHGDGDAVYPWPPAIGYKGYFHGTSQSIVYRDYARKSSTCPLYDSN